MNRNKWWAVQVREQGGGTFEGNDVRENERSDWNIAADSVDKVKRADNIE
jgi:hypothetical protein